MTQQEEMKEEQARGRGRGAGVDGKTRSKGELREERRILEYIYHFIATKPSLYK